MATEADVSNANTEKGKGRASGSSNISWAHLKVLSKSSSSTLFAISGAELLTEVSAIYSYGLLLKVFSEYDMPHTNSEGSYHMTLPETIYSAHLRQSFRTTVCNRRF